MGDLSVVFSREEKMLIHGIDRRLYAILALQLCLNPLEALKIMAFWLCLERIGFINTVKTILSLQKSQISQIADEALTCLKFLTTSPFMSSSQVTHLPLTKRTISENINLQFLNENRASVIMHLTEVTYEVCYVALIDIMQEAEKRNAARYSAETDMMIASLPDPDTLISGDELLTHPPVNPVDRTLSVTFSRGYPVAEKEMRDFFTRLHGDCIESVFMQQVKPGEQSLYARVIFHSPSTIKDILKGTRKAKYTINGKHAWMRKYIVKNNGTPSAEKGLLPRPKGPVA